MYFTNDFLWTSPAYWPSLRTQTYLNPSLTKHWYTRSIGEWMSKATGAYMVCKHVVKLDHSWHNSLDRYMMLNLRDHTLDLLLQCHGKL
jgi:hypothetical protein